MCDVSHPSDCDMLITLNLNLLVLASISVLRCRIADDDPPLYCTTAVTASDLVNLLYERLPVDWITKRPATMTCGNTTKDTCMLPSRPACFHSGHIASTQRSTNHSQSVRLPSSSKIGSNDALPSQRPKRPCPPVRGKSTKKARTPGGVIPLLLTSVLAPTCPMARLGETSALLS